MSKLKLGVLFALALGLALIMQAPAWLISQRLPELSQGEAELRDVQGTLWRGSAILHLPKHGLTLDKLTWRFRPLALPGLEWRYAVTIEDAELLATGGVGATFTGIVISEAQADMGARSATALFPLAATFSPEGKLTANIRKLSCANIRCDGDATLQWREAGLALAELRPLGDYQLAATFNAGRADYELKTNKGTLRAAGRGTWEPGKRPTFTGEVSAPPDQLPKVQGLLRLLGTPDERGVVRISR